MNKVSANIRRIREQKGYSQEYMAQELEISQASYARIENEETKLSIDRLFEIANILETDISSLLGSEKLTINHQENHEGSFGNGYIQNLHIENKEVYEKLIKNLEEQIDFLKKRLDKYE
ncbi:XRE family transcriptional regulator [Ornithobacterium rhinotracheale]|uniref:XRE family transcriptional regulator n=1 Tax=Ornithobacterium rhinotracheale TaxID=28251 RepID=A0A410JNY7_ORNRH|nr:helix-turn-helix transcriptional regulator [Ornithobacterium rhinotracheale]QAR29873.1 XRE family transcriptional regulator [Ornithobacterium rhinotracheale]